MSAGVSISKTGSSVRVVAPYNKGFVDDARLLAGRWEKPAWVFDALVETQVREACMSWYGSDGVITRTCTVRVNFPPHFSKNGPIRLGGRPIAEAIGRAAGVTLGRDVILLSGGFGSAGSYAHPRTVVDEEGATVLLRDFPTARAELLIAKPQRGIVVTIVPEVAMDAEALTAERGRLMARLAEIDALLKDAEEQETGA